MMRIGRESNHQTTTFSLLFLFLFCAQIKKSAINTIMKTIMLLPIVLPVIASHNSPLTILHLSILTGEIASEELVFCYGPWHYRNFFI